MGHEKGKKFFSSYEGDQIDALLGAMAQANPMPSGTDWVAFIDDCREAQDAAEAAAASVEGAEETCAQSAASAADSANAAHEDADRAEEAAAHVDLPVKRGSGLNSLVVGDMTNIASGEEAYAEGERTTASATASHSGGWETVASGVASHAEGVRTTASGIGSHAEGDGSIASGNNSHVEGNGTIANKWLNHVFGKYNIEDSGETNVGEFIEIVGNGSSDNNRSNARTLDWQGNERLAGKLTLGALPTGAMDAVPRCLVTNPNLLDNAYFVGGGTGYGIFPVNQRGQTQYSGGGAKVFDRWAIGSGGGAADLLSGGVKFTCGNNQSVYQRLSTRPADLFGKELTLSAVDTDGNLYTGTGTAPSAATAGNVISISITGFGTLVLAYSTAVSLFYVAFNGRSGSSPITIAAVKLERGSIQTLAHQESGAWILNSVPRYDEELRRCQNRLWLESNVPSNAYVVTSGVATSATSAIFSLFLPANLAKSSNPTAIFNNIGVYSNTSNASRNVSALSIVSIVGNSVGLTATISGATAGESLRLVVLQGGSIGVSTEV